MILPTTTSNSHQHISVWTKKFNLWATNQLVEPHCHSQSQAVSNSVNFLDIEISLRQTFEQQWAGLDPQLPKQKNKRNKKDTIFPCPVQFSKRVNLWSCSFHNFFSAKPFHSHWMPVDKSQQTRETLVVLSSYLTLSG